MPSDSGSDELPPPCRGFSMKAAWYLTRTARQSSLDSGFSSCRKTPLRNLHVFSAKIEIHVLSHTVGFPSRPRRGNHRTRFTVQPEWLPSYSTLDWSQRLRWELDRLPNACRFRLARFRHLPVCR